jgi:hypothetical protein
VIVEPPSTVRPLSTFLTAARGDALDVDALVLPEALVLDRDRRGAQLARHLAARDLEPQHVGPDEPSAGRRRRRQPLAVAA